MDHDCLQISFTLCLHIRARLLKCDTNVFPDGRTLWTSKRGWILNSRVGISFVYSVLVTSARPTFCGLECNRKCGCFYFLTSSPFTCRVCGGRLWGGGGRRGPTTWISPASAEVRTRPSVFSRPSRVSYRTIAHSSPIYKYGCKCIFEIIFHATLGLHLNSSLRLRGRRHFRGRPWRGCRGTSKLSPHPFKYDGNAMHARKAKFISARWDLG